MPLHDAARSAARHDCRCSQPIQLCPAPRRWFDFDSNCVVSRGEFRKAYRALKASCARHGEQREWFSYAGKRADVMRHKRLPYEPQDTLVGNVTEAQRIGCALLRLAHVLRGALVTAGMAVCQCCVLHCARMELLVSL
jgi:hypothetical protein